MAQYNLPTHFGRQRHQSYEYQQFTESYSEHADYDIEGTFSKCFVFSTDKSLNRFFKLPEPASLFKEEKWKLLDFDDLKHILNVTKCKLNNLILKDWHQHTNNTNIAGDVLKHIRHNAGPEFLTQAWCKMYECLMAFWLVPEHLSDGVFNTVHLCEAPGAFVTALHHFLQTWYPNAQWNWLATTLNPYYEGNPLSKMIADDRFIMHTLPHWTFGKDETGDIMDIDNLWHLQSRVNTQLGGNVMLVTADGSIDCQNNPAEQEKVVAPLHYCETIAALSILQPGGCFLLKMFTLLECESICLLYLLACVFTLVHAFKPVKSKEGNSEVYIVCQGYGGINSLQPWMTTLLENYGQTMRKALFSQVDIPQDFIAQVYECAKGFNETQIRVINRNLELFQFPDPARLHYCYAIKKRVAERYLDQYHIKRVSRVIVGNDVLMATPMYNLAPRLEEGTYNDRVNKGSPDLSVVLANATAAVGPWPFGDNACWFMLNGQDPPPLNIVSGRPMTSVQSSKFCHGQVLSAFTDAVPYAPIILPLQSELRTSVIVDVSHLPWTTFHSLCHQKLLEILQPHLRDLPPDKSLCVRGIPLLTQFNVAVVLLLAHSFFQMALTNGGNVILCGYMQATTNTTHWIQHVLDQMNALPHSQAIISLLPINVLCDKKYRAENGDNFYYCVSCVNHATLLRSLEAMVTKSESTSDED